MKKAIRITLLGLLGASMGLYVMAGPLTTITYASTPYYYYNYGGTYANTAKSTQDPVMVVKAASHDLGFNADTDKYTLVSKNTTSAIVKVVHNGKNYNVILQSRSDGSWKITSVKLISGNISSANSNITTNDNSSTTNSANTSTVAGSISVAEAEKQAVNLLNADRRANGLPDLQVDSRVTTVARNHAQDMVNRNYFSHYSPEGQSPFDRLKQAGISYSAAGENIGMNQSIQNAEIAFMNSSGHRANILNSAFTKIGIGVAYDKSGNIYIVQNFIKP